MKKKNYGISAMLVVYSIVTLILATIITCNASKSSDLSNWIGGSMTAFSILAVVCANIWYCINVKCRKQGELEEKIKELENENKKLHTELDAAKADKTQEQQNLKLLREHEERMAIIKTLRVNNNNTEEEALKQKLDEVVKKLNKLK